MVQDEDGSVPSEDEDLDELLLLLLANDGSSVAEVFSERRHRVRFALRLSPEGAEWGSPWRRRDEGTALRLVRTGQVRSGHVSGGSPEALRELARSGCSAPVALEPIGSRAPSEEERGQGVPPGLVGRRLEEAAAFLRVEAEAEPRLHRARAELVHEERRIHVLSSEWGHAHDRREGWRLELGLELADETGRRSTALRSHGWTAEAPERAFGRLVDELFACAREGLEARSPPGGSPAIVLAAGGGAVLVHEAVGHALEADVAARSGTVLAGRLGERVAPDFVSVVDDPSRPGRAGSAVCDDEGVPGRAVALIDAGRVGEPLRDGLRCGFDLARATGHGRRASHRVAPMPRMTNTCLLPGTADLDELFSAAGTGLLVERLERGSFDPATGAFRLRVSESRLIEAGRPGRALSGYWLEGDTLGLLAGIAGLGGDLAWDDGCGTCGRDGQWLPVAAGCPSVLLREGTLRVC